MVVVSAGELDDMPFGEETGDRIAQLLADVELYQYPGVVVETRRSPRPSAMISVAVMPPLGVG